MPTLTAFHAARHYPADARRGDAPAGMHVADSFGDVAAEYDALSTRAGLVDRSDRGRVVVTGADRARWLSGLVTNVVQTLDSGSGNYAFALDPRGRVVFDVIILAVGEALWLDVDGEVVAAALKHLDRYLFSESVRLADASAEDARLAVYGPSAVDVARALGNTNFAALPALGHLLVGPDVRLVRNDLGRVPGFELIVPREQAAAWWDRLVEAGAQPAGWQAFHALRIEAGVPWLGLDIDEQVLPPETGQIERGISLSKGCFVGYEILERMRSRGALARRLVGLRAEGGGALAAGDVLRQGGGVVGRVTSVARHPRTGRWIGLGYLKTGLPSHDGIVAGESGQSVVIVPLPAA